MHNKITCRCCGREFYSRLSKATYCSNACKFKGNKPPAGSRRALVYSPETMAEKIEKYMAMPGDKSVNGMALFLKISCQAILDYQRREGFREIITSAKNKMGVKPLDEGIWQRQRKSESVEPKPELTKESHAMLGVSYT